MLVDRPSDGYAVNSTFHHFFVCFCLFHCIVLNWQKPCEQIEKT